MSVSMPNEQRFHFKTAQKLNIAGQQINDVHSYSVKQYKDAKTNNGKYYSISAKDRDVSLFTGDDKFLSMTERFRKPNMVVNGKYLKGDITHQVFADKTQVYEAVTNNGAFKTIKLDAFGNEIKKMTLGSRLAKIFKNIIKLK